MAEEGLDGSDDSEKESEGQDHDHDLDREIEPWHRRNPNSAGKLVELAIALLPAMAERQDGTTLAMAVVVLVLVIALTA